MQISFTQVSLTSHSHSLTQVSRTQISPMLVSLTQVSLMQFSPMLVSLTQVSLMQVSLTQVILTQYFDYWETFSVYGRISPVIEALGFLTDFEQMLNESVSNK